MKNLLLCTLLATTFSSMGNDDTNLRRPLSYNEILSESICLSSSGMDRRIACRGNSTLLSSGGYIAGEESDGAGNGGGPRPGEIPISFDERPITISGGSGNGISSRPIESADLAESLIEEANIAFADLHWTFDVEENSLTFTCGVEVLEFEFENSGLTNQVAKEIEDQITQ